MSRPTLLRRIFEPLGRLVVFGGRTGRADFWPYMGLLVAVYVAGSIAAFALFSMRVGSLVANIYAVTILVVLLAFAAVVRRLHDVGWSGRWMAAYVVLLSIFVGCFLYWRYGVLSAPHDPFAPPPMARLMPLMMMLVLAANGTGLLIFVLCTRQGTSGSNRYGPNPRDDPAGEAA